LLELARKREIQGSLHKRNLEEFRREKELIIEKYCNEKTAIEFFKTHLDFYYPHYRIISKIKVKQSGDTFPSCRYELSQTLVDSRYPSLTKTLVVEVAISQFIIDQEEPDFHIKIIKGYLVE